MQGLYPGMSLRPVSNSSDMELISLFSAATTSNNVKLANGSTITSPLGGYTYVPIQVSIRSRAPHMRKLRLSLSQTVEPDEDISLEGWTSCPAFIKRNNEVCQSRARRRARLARLLNLFAYLQMPPPSSRPRRPRQLPSLRHSSRSWATARSRSRTCGVCPPEAISLRRFACC